MTLPDELRSRLPLAALELLDCKDGRYSEWSTASALAMYALNANIDEDEFVAVVSASDFAYEFATENGQDRSSRLENRLRKVWHRAEEDWEPPIGSIEEVRAKLEQLSERLAAWRWTGRSGSKDRAVALALVAWAHEVGAWTLGASVRDVSVRAGVAHDTARNSLRRLESLGVIRKDAAPREGNNAQRWEIRLGWGVRDVTRSYEPLPPRERSCGLTTGISHPVFVGSALGQTAERVWLDVLAHPDSTASEIAGRTGVRSKTVRATLRTKLMPNHLVKESGVRAAKRCRPSSIYQAVDSDTNRLDLIADDYGVSDWYERTSERYTRQRAAYIEKLKITAEGTN